jgi:HEAT repeat protein
MHQRAIRVVISSAAAMILQIIFSSAQTPESAGDTTAKIKQMTERLGSEPLSFTRLEICLQLSQLVRLQAQSSSAGLDDPSLIASLTDLLRHDDDLVRYCSATALGQIGAPAASAVPALEEALKKAPTHVELVPGGWNVAVAASSARAIRDALQTIRGAVQANLVSVPKRGD